MAEPSTITAAGSASLAALIIGLLPGIDANAVVGAFCGAALFVVSAEDLRAFERIIYLFISFLIGYLGGPNMLGGILDHTAVSAFIAAACAVTFGLRAIEGVKTLDLKAWLGGKK